MTQMSIVSSRGVLVKRESTSKDAMTKFVSCVCISSAKAKVSLTANPLVVSGLTILTRNLANFYAGVLIDDNSGRSLGLLFTTTFDKS